MIKQLRALLDKKAFQYTIRAKSEEIYNASIQLLRKHGEGSDVGTWLGYIKNAATKMMRFCEGRGLLGNKVEFDHQKAGGLVESMELSIKKIGVILRIEFKETQS